MASPKSLLKGFERVIASTKPDPAKRITLSDPDQRGLYVRITPAGTKTYLAMARTPYGKQVWATLGNADATSLTEAREAAREAVLRIKAGKPATEKPPALPDTFAAVAENFLVRHVKKQALRTEREIERVLRKYVMPKWKDLPITDISRGDVSSLLDKIEDENGATMADRTLAIISKLFNWHTARNDDFVSPVVRGMGRAGSTKDRARKRILADDEIRLVWAAAEKKGGFGRLVQLSLLTAQRRAKVSAIRWEDIDGDGVWTIPTEAREKDNPGELKLPPLALDTIRQQIRIEGNPYVFPGSKRGSHIGGFSKFKVDLDEEIKKANKGKSLPGWTLHDLRRTAKSLMARAGVRPDISERVLGHAIRGVEGVYDRHQYADEKADALKRLAGLIEKILDPPKGNVVDLREAAE